jgi:drug/metabolite transporter (DMT)-like permease
MSGKMLPARGSAGAGYAAVAAAAVLWAAGGAVARHVIGEGASLLELTEARAWISALVLGAMVWMKGEDGGRGGRPPLGLVVVFGLSIAAANYCYYASLARLPVAVAITIQYTAPALVVGWTVIVDRFRPSVRLVAALVCAVAGVALLAELPAVVQEGHLRLSGAGVAFAIAAAFAFATYMVSGQRLGRSVGARGAVARGFVVAAVLWAGVQLARGRPDTLLQVRFLPWVLFLAIATTVVPFLLFVWGLERVPAPNAGIVSTLEPLTAAVIAFAWLGERLSAGQIAGALMVLIGIGVVQLERPAPSEVLVQRAAIGE